MSNSSGLTGLLPTPHGNLTLIENNDLCTLATCDLTLAHTDYLPSLPGNAFLAAIFALCLVAQFVLGIKYRTWGFMAATTLGMLTEIIGYIGRIMMHNNPFSKDNFLIYLVTLTIAPAFLSAAIYLCLARIVVVYGEEKSRFKPRVYTLVFCGCDFLALLLQAAGGAIASTAGTDSSTQEGINIMLAGLSFQVFSLVLFSVCCIEFGLRVYFSSRTSAHPYRQTLEQDQLRPNSPTSIRSGAPLHTSLPNSTLFRAFLVGLGVATLTIFVRSCFRVAELSGGFHGPLANNQISFMILEGTMVIIACLALTILHPGICFLGEWRAANFKLGKVKGVSEEKSIISSASRTDAELGVVEPPAYNTAGDCTSTRAGSPLGLRATTMQGTTVRPGQVSVEMVPIYGTSYEDSSERFPRPTM